MTEEKYRISFFKEMLNIVTHPVVIGGITLAETINSFTDENYQRGIVFSAFLAYGAFAYAKGIFPFTEIKGPPAYEMAEWFFEKPALPLKGPGTKFLVWPILRKIKKNGEVLRIPATIQERDMEMNFQQSSDNGGAAGTIKLQYGALIPTRQDAKKFYLTTGGNFGYIDDMIKTHVGKKIANTTLDDLIRQRYSESIQEEINSDPTGPYERNGVQIAKISLQPAEFDERTKTALRANLDARALLIKAEAQMKESLIQQQATTESLQGYVMAVIKAAEIAGLTMNPEQIFREAMRLQIGDNLQQTLSNSRAGTLINIRPEEIS